MAKRQTESTQSPVALDWSNGADVRQSAIASAMQALSGAAHAATEQDMPVSVLEAKAAAKAAQDKMTATEAAVAGLDPAIASGALLIAKDALTLALGNLALVEAQAELDSERDAKIADATARAANLPAEYKAAALDAMLRAIEAEYAPAPDEAPEQTEAPAEAPQAAPSGRKQPSALTLAKNAEASANPELRQRAASIIAAFNGSADIADCKCMRLAGTRYAGVVTFASTGAGVANYADYQSVARAVLAELAAMGLPSGGKSTIELGWLQRSGAQAPDGKKANDWFGTCFVSGASIALYPDGRFRLARPNTPNVRFIATDASARQTFNGGSASAAQSAPSASQQAAQTTQAAFVPTPPPAQQASQQAAVTTPLSQCQHCAARNVAGRATCHYCDAPDWNASA